jgi:hypothetical protein
VTPRLHRIVRVALLVLPLAAATFVVALLIGDDDSAPELDTTAVTVAADEPTFSSLDGLLRASDAVVAGVVDHVEEGRAISDPSDVRSGIRTQLASVRVDEVLAGDVASEIVIEQEATLLDGTPIEVNGMAPLEAGQVGIYFLIAGDGEEFPYFALVNRQGHYEVVDDRLVAGSDDALSRHLAAMTPDALRCAISDC